MIVMEAHTDKLNSPLLISCVYKLSSQPYTTIPVSHVGPWKNQSPTPVLGYLSKNENPS